MRTHNKDTRTEQARMAEKARMAAAIKTAEQAYESNLQRQIDELCKVEHEQADTFELLLKEKVFYLHYAGKGHLPSYKAGQQPDTIYFILSIESTGETGCFILRTNAFATPEMIRKELDLLELPCKVNKAINQ